MAGVPMAVTYRVNPISGFLGRRLIKVPHVAMINLLAGRALVPELLQEQCRPDILAATVLALLRDPAKAAAQREGFTAALASLRAPEGAPSDAAAQAILRGAGLACTGLQPSLISPCDFHLIRTSLHE